MRVYTDEDVFRSTVEALRQAGHDVVTALEAGLANTGVADRLQLEFAVAHGRLIVTMNRNDFSQLHRRGIAHHGIVLCTQRMAAVDNGAALVAALEAYPQLEGRLLRIEAGRTVLEPPRPG